MTLLNKRQSTVLWIKYMEPDALFELLDSLVESISHNSGEDVRIVLEAIIFSLKTFKQTNHLEIGKRWQQLWTLRSYYLDLLPLEELIAYSASSYLPACHDGSLFDLSLVNSLAELSESVQARWTSRISAPLHIPNLLDMLQKKPWTKFTPRIVSSLMYHPSGRAAFLQFIGSKHCADVASSDLVMITRAYLDSSIRQGASLNPEEGRILSSHFLLVLSSLRNDMAAMSSTMKRLHMDYLFLTIQYTDSDRSELLDSLQSHIKSASIDDISHYLILGRRLHRLLGGDRSGICLCLVESILPWATRAMSMDSNLSNETSQSIVNLSE